MTVPDQDNKIDNDDNTATPDEEKTRSGIQSIEVGFRLIEVLTEASNAMMLRDLAHAAGMNPAKAHRY
uniref:helix-turn-helix domain-containing protein n=1 Tax=Pandoraea sp. PE-S2R-1 TaxID=1986994 RepID=UPI00201689B3